MSGSRPTKTKAGAAQTLSRTAESDEPEDRYASGFDFLLVNGPMEGDLFPKVVGCVSQGKKNNRIVVVIVTYGGLADVAYRVGRYLQSVYDEVVAFTPSACKSAGTLLAAAANTLVLAPFGELGPLDVQLRKKDEIYGRRSGLITRAAMEDLQRHAFDLFESFMLGIITHSYGSVSFKVAADVSARTASDLMGRIYDQISPELVGQDYRDLNVATKYCERLGRWSRNIKPDGIERLVHGYPSHDFVIDAEEAKEIFERVERPTGTLFGIMRRHINNMVLPFGSDAYVIEFVVPEEATTATAEKDGDNVPGTGGEGSPAVKNGRDQDGAPAAS